MNNVDLLFQKINEGREGKNIGLSTGIPKLDKYTGGIQKVGYTLIFGLSGSGKSSFALYSYIYRPLKDHPEIDQKMLYFSLEMGADMLLAKLLGLWIYEEYGRIISYSSIMSWKSPLSNEDYNYILAGKKWLESISHKLIIVDSNLTSKSFYSRMLTFLGECGRFEDSADGKRKLYIKNNPDQIISVILDHIGLCVTCDGHTKKEEIDLISQYMVSLRERCGISFYVLQQENRNSASSDRMKMDLTDCSLDGLKDSGNTGNDSWVCIGVYCPLKFKLKTKYDYPIICEDQGDGFVGLRDRIRFLQIVKNRTGESDRSIPVAFYGENGYFVPMPKANEIKDFSLYMHLDTVPSTENKIQNEVEDNTSKNDKKEIVYKF